MRIVKNHLMCALLATGLLSTASHAQPKLVLQITVDGLRADLINRYRDNFGKGGFNYLLKNGVVYTNAHYLHANTETIVGHTTLATGATPAVHGMVGNVWYNASNGELGYNIEDPEAPILSTRENAPEGAQVDPAQLRATTDGRSPRGILVPTFSDTLKIASAGDSKVFGISGKDRSAVALAGKTGTAYWYSTDTGDFETSAYYMDDYPDWVSRWNAQRRAVALGSSPWQLLLEPGAYRFADRDDRPYEVDLRGFGRTFPHDYGASDHPLFFTRVIVSPAGDKLLLEFAKELMVAEAVGQDEVTDFLSISFSSVDAVNHFFGPSSLENEDTVIQLDRILEELLAFVDETVGMKNTLVVLSADHGSAEMPEYATELGYDAGRMYNDEVLGKSKAIASDLFGDDAVIKDFFRPYLYLDSSVIESLGLKQDVVTEALATALTALPGVGAAYSKHGANPVKSIQYEAVRHNLHERRSGDIYIFQPPYWFMFDRGPIGAMHGSPWSYDTHVPIIFAGPGIRPSTVHRLVHPIDIAPTLSALLGLSPPAGAQGTALPEVIGDGKRR